MKKNIISLFVVLSISGCSAGNELSYSKKAYENTDMDFVGIPSVLGVGALGTRFPITPHYSLTAKHVAKYSLDKVISYHPTCDVALVKTNNEGKLLPTLSSAGVDMLVTNYGYSFISAMPIESSGKIEQYIKMENTYNSLKCPVMLSTAGIRKGMSGGPVYNNKNDNIIGVNVSYTSSILTKNNNGEEKIEKANNSMFVPFQNLNIWLENEINKTEDKGLLKINHQYDFYNNDSGDKGKDYIKNKPYEEKL